MIVSMPEFIAEHGLLALFFVSFCAATLLPLGSEWLLVALLLQGSNPVVTVTIATLGNSLGAATNYLIGYHGGNWITAKVLRINRQQLQRAEQWFNRYGSWSLLLAWLPIVGDPLCLVSGTLKTPPLRFTLLVTVGKLARYTFLALVTLQSASLLT